MPASLAASGKRERHFHPTRDAAREHTERLRAQFLEHGTAVSTLKPSVADDAVAALAILEPWGATLTEAARMFAEARKREAASRSVVEAVAAFLEASEGLRPRTLNGYRQALRKLEAAHGGRNLATLGAEEIVEAVELNRFGASAANRFRSFRTFWNWCARKGWCEASILSSIESPRVGDNGEIEILTPGEAQELLTIAEEHFPQAVASFALQLFAGIRAEELERLEAADVSPEGIELSSRVTKKGRRRHITPNATLHDWLIAYPFEPCPSWRAVSAAVRRLAGWKVASRLLSDPPEPARGDWPQNAMRHSHASYAVAAGEPLERLLFEFGHVGTPAVLRAHYVGRASKKDALQFFAIRPGATAARSSFGVVA